MHVGMGGMGPTVGPTGGVGSMVGVGVMLTPGGEEPGYDGDGPAELAASHDAAGVGAGAGGGTQTKSSAETGASDATSRPDKPLPIANATHLPLTRWTHGPNPFNLVGCELQTCLSKTPTHWMPLRPT